MPTQYYFDELEPINFQRLINALLVLRYGEGIRLLPLRGQDGGRDAETAPGSSYFTVHIPQPVDGRNPGPVKPGRYLFQVKHHRMTDRVGTLIRSTVLQEFVDELRNNVIPRTGDEKVDYFFLITNVPSTRDVFQRVDERRREQLRGHPDVHADILWQEHLIAWLDQAVAVWPSFPEMFPGKVVPYLGRIAGNEDGGLPRAIKLAISEQFRRDSTIRFRQISLEQRLSRLFVDLDARPIDSSFRVYYRPVQLQSTLLLPADPSAQFSHSYVYDPGALALLMSDSHKRLGRIILEGGPGQGKSTLTQMLVQVYRSLLIRPDLEYKSYAAQIIKAKLPIRIELRLFAEWLADTKRSVEQYIAEVFSKDSGGSAVTVDDIHLIVSKQNVLLIFDGLDEVGSDPLRDDVVAQISACISRFEAAAVESDLQVIVTSRPPAIAGRLDALSGFIRVQLLPLSDHKVDLYLDRWTEVQCIDRVDRERVITSFSKRRNEDHVAALVKNPMQLSVLLHFIRLKGEAFPDKRAELYREYFKTVIDRDVEKSPELLRNRDDIETLHEVIGFTLHSRAEQSNSAARLNRTELIALVRAWFQSEGRRSDLGEQLFRIGEERLGLIVALSGEGALTQYGFEIQPVREYFTAAFINDKCEGDAHELFQLMVRRPFWREVARFLAGLRRANERADLLARARELDEDSDEGWRSDGAFIVYQLLQEGVFTAPGHVNRDALSFIIRTLDPSSPRVQFVPKEFTFNLPRLIRACDSDHPLQLLKGFLAASRTMTDHGSLQRLWSVCHKVLDPDYLFAEMCAYHGDYEIEAALKLLWPSHSQKSYAMRLEAANELKRIPRHILSRYWFAAALSDRDVMQLRSTAEYHSLLLEQFAFRGLAYSDPVDPAASPFAVWQLCAWLYKAALSIRNEKDEQLSEGVPPDFSGLPGDDSAAIGPLIELLKQVARTPRAGKKRAVDSLASKLIELMTADGILGLIGGRCAATLLGYAEGPKLMAEQDQAYWMYHQRRSIRFSSAAWDDMKRALLRRYQAAFPVEADRRGRSNAYRLVSQGFYKDLQSSVVLDGEFKPILSLLRSKTARADDGSSGWGTRIAVQQYWLQSFLTAANVEHVLSLLGHHDLEWAGTVLPLSMDQVGYVADVVKSTRDASICASAIFALGGSKIWGRIKDQALMKMLKADSASVGHAGLIFDRNRYPGVSTPQALMRVAQKILDGSVQVCPSVALAAARFASENKPLILKPLRETSAFPSLRNGMSV